MSTETAQIVAKAWNFAHVLRDVGLSYLAYTEQITFLLFLKMADELTRPPHGRKPIVPAPYDWPNLLKREGDELETHYRRTLEELGKKQGMLGQIFLKARPDIQNPALLYRLIRTLIEPQTWTSLEADVKGDIYEGLLAKSAEESPKGAGQYFTPRPLSRGLSIASARPRTTRCATRRAAPAGSCSRRGSTSCGTRGSNSTRTRSGTSAGRSPPAGNWCRTRPGCA